MSTIERGALTDDGAFGHADVVAAIVDGAPPVTAAQVELLRAAGHPAGPTTRSAGTGNGNGAGSRGGTCKGLSEG